jgi:5-methylcytosine-specific restriction protein A
MKKLCSYAGCKTVVEVQPGDRNPPRCELHPAQGFTPKQRPSHQYVNGRRLYNTSRWQKLRDRYAQHQPLCEHCLKAGLSVLGDEVDHIREIEDGGDPWGWDNLQHLCTAHHRAKTAREASKRRRKKKQNGFGCISDF